MKDFSSAIDDFRRARQRAAMEVILARLTGRSADLLSFEDVRQKLRANTDHSQGLREIPLDAIVGSRGRYHDFTRSFLPRQDSTADRWARIEMAMTDLQQPPSGGKKLPPIWVYKIGEAYFVDDGHHRVSVARQLGATHIRAYVTEIDTKVPLSPDVQPDELILKAEYADFLERTHLDELRPGADLTVTVSGRYRAIEEHIEIQRHFISQKQKREIPHAEAVVHWYDEVYWPVVQAIREQGILRDFPRRTETDLYVWLSEHRAALENELGWEVRPETAATDLSAQFSPKPQRIIARVSEKIREAFVPEELEAGPPAGQWRREHLQAQRRDRLFEDILVPISGDEIGWQALAQAIEIARHEGSRLHGLHVRRIANLFYSGEIAWLAHADAQRLKGQATDMSYQDSPQAKAIKAEFERRCQVAEVPGELTVETGRVAARICEWGRWADLIVIKLTFPPGLQPIARLGSGFRYIIRRCPTPLLAVPRASYSLERALLAYDGSPKADEALFLAAYLASRRNISLEVVSVIEPGRDRSKALARAKEYLEEYEVQATFSQRRGAAAKVILEAARAHKSDFIIMGGYGSGPMLEVVLGSTVDRVLRASRQPVLICQ